MPLPKCIRTSDVETKNTLLSDGWRLIGQLATFNRKETAGINPLVLERPVQLFEAQAAAKEILWRGRLFRDSEVPMALARKHIEKIVADADNKSYITNGCLIVYKDSESRLVLFGRLPDGNARKALARLSRGTVAGTYTDNWRAVWAYLDSGFIPVGKEWVLHK